MISDLYLTGIIAGDSDKKMAIMTVNSVFFEEKELKGERMLLGRQRALVSSRLPQNAFQR